MSQEQPQNNPNKIGLIVEDADAVEMHDANTGQDVILKRPAGQPIGEQAKDAKLKPIHETPK